MLKEREIKLSLRDRLSLMFSSNEEGVFQRAWNVYNESQLRQAVNGQFTPTVPFLYLVDTYLPPMGQADVTKTQPWLAIEIDEYIKRPFEAGTRSGRYVKVFLQILGKSRGERDDIASFIVDYLGDAVTINAYGFAGDTGSVVETAQLVPMNSNGDLIIKEDMFTARTGLADDVAFSTSVLGWTRIGLAFVCKV
jgi:hypothetical protein